MKNKQDKYEVSVTVGQWDNYDASKYGENYDGEISPWKMNYIGGFDLNSDIHPKDLILTKVKNLLMNSNRVHSIATSGVQWYVSINVYKRSPINNGSGLDFGDYSCYYKDFEFDYKKMLRKNKINTLKN